MSTHDKDLADGAGEGNAARMTELLEKEADRHQQGIDGTTALTEATGNGHAVIVNTLLYAHAKDSSHYSDVP